MVQTIIPYGPNHHTLGPQPSYHMTQMVTMWEHLSAGNLTRCRGGCCRGCCEAHEDTQEDLHAEFSLDDSTVPQPPGHEPLLLLDRALDHRGHQLHLLDVVEVGGQAHQLVHVATLAHVPPLGDLEKLLTAEVLE